MGDLYQTTEMRGACRNWIVYRLVDIQTRSPPGHRPNQTHLFRFDPVLDLRAVTTHDARPVITIEPDSMQKMTLLALAARRLKLDNFLVAEAEELSK